MNLPIEIISIIFSFLHSNDIKLLELPYDYFKRYLHEKLDKQSYFENF